MADDIAVVVILAGFDEIKIEIFPHIHRPGSWPDPQAEAKPERPGNRGTKR